MTAVRIVRLGLVLLTVLVNVTYPLTSFAQDDGHPDGDVRRRTETEDAKARERQDEEVIARSREPWRGEDLTNRAKPEFLDANSLEAKIQAQDIQANRDAMPSDARQALEEIEQGKSRSNVRNPKKYENDGRSGSERLPEQDKSGKQISYMEYTINPRPQGGSLDSKRLVGGSDGTMYYTDSHFKSFSRIK
jgi:guanyl-specific ribonuclease Sa